MIPVNLDQLPGGLADNNVPTDFCPQQLARGIQVELEHTQDITVAMEIAMDHLAEIPDYYTRLDRMEQEAEMKRETLVMTIGQLKHLMKEAIEFANDETGELSRELPDKAVADLMKRLNLTDTSLHDDNGGETIWVSPKDFDKVEQELNKHRDYWNRPPDLTGERDWQNYRDELQRRARLKKWDREDAQNYAQAQDALTRLLDQAEEAGREYAADNP